MKLVLTGPTNLVEELKSCSALPEWIVVPGSELFNDIRDASGFFDLNPDAPFPKDFAHPAPLFLNRVALTLGADNAIRINAWPGFLSHSTWEVCGTIPGNAAEVLEVLQKKTIPCMDVPGLISAGVIAMIINEAFFAFEDGISSKADIDTAMKLGTNYPFGPFEWSEIIGLKNIYTLLEAMCATDARYAASTGLTKEALPA